MLTKTWDRTNHNDIFSIIQNRTGCMYISDLRRIKYGVMIELSRIDLSDFDQREINDFAQYVFGTDYNGLHKILDMQNQKD